MIHQGPTRLDAGDEAITVTTNLSSARQSPAIVAVTFKIKYVVTTVDLIVIVEALTRGDSTNWQSIYCINAATPAFVAAGNITLSNGTDYILRVPDCADTDKVRLRVISITSGSVDVNAISLVGAEVPRNYIPVSLTVPGQNITSTSATAFTVGQAGTTNPAFTVDASTASSTTGIKIKSAAGTGRAALSVTSDQTNEGLSIDAKGSGTILLGATSTGAVSFSRAAVPTANDGVALGTTALGWADLFLATGGVINWANGEVTLSAATDTLTMVGATAFVTGAVTVALTGTRWVTSYHTNLVSTNAVTVDSSMTVKDDIKPYEGDALDVLDKMNVVTFRHKDHLKDQKQKLGIIAESVNEPLALDYIPRADGLTTYPGVNMYALDSLTIKAIQQLNRKVKELERTAA